MGTIKEEMDKLNIVITDRSIVKLHRTVISYSQKYTEAFHTSTIGLEKAIFTQRDQNALFDIFDVYVPDLKKAIRRMDAIDPKFKVISDPFNQLCFYLLHKAFKLNDKDRKKFQILIFTYLNYKFFTSITNNFFKYPPSKEKLIYVINNLSGRYIIKQYGTWYNYIKHISTSFSEGKNIHFNNLKTFKKDDKIIYAISNTQGKMKSVIKNISNEFYDNKDDMVGIKTFNSVLEGPESKYLNEDINKTYIRINNIKTEITNEHLFIDRKLIEAMIKKDFKTLNKHHRVLYRTLTHISQEAFDQVRNNKFNEIFVKDDKNEFVAIGTLINDILIFVNNLIQLKKIKIKSISDIYIYLKKYITSPRIINEDVTYLRYRVQKLVEDSNMSKRKSTTNNITTFLTLYIFIKGYKSEV